MLSFKLRVKAPGDETMVPLYLSRAAAGHGNWYKFDPVNTEWRDYSAYTKFGVDRKVVYLSLKDGGFDDADGIENGIIVDPQAFDLSAAGLAWDLVELIRDGPSQSFKINAKLFQERTERSFKFGFASSLTAGDVCLAPD